MAWTVKFPDPRQIDEMARHLVRQGRIHDPIEVRVPAHLPVGSLARDAQTDACFPVVASRLQPGVNVIVTTAREWLALRGLAGGPSE